MLNKQAIKEEAGWWARTMLWSTAIILFGMDALFGLDRAMEPFRSGRGAPPLDAVLWTTLIAGGVFVAWFFVVRGVCRRNKERGLTQAQVDRLMVIEKQVTLRRATQEENVYG